MGHYGSCLDKNEMVVRRMYSTFFSACCGTGFIAFWAVLGLVAQLPAAHAAEGELDLDGLNPEQLNPEQISPQQTSPEQISPDRLDAPMPTVTPTDNALEVTVIEEVPEEILRTEIITGARSPLTGEPLTAVEYAQLQAELAGPAGGNLVSQDIKYLIFLLQLRRAIKPIVPFIN